MGRPVAVCVCMFMVGVGVRVMSLMWETPSLVIHSSRPLSVARAAASLRPSWPPLPLPPSVIPGVPESRRKPPPSRGPSSASVTPAATGAAVAAVGLLLQVVERVYHVLQTVHVVPTKTVVIL